jgi:Ca2+-binding RTX toxin-like protein
MKTAISILTVMLVVGSATAQGATTSGVNLKIRGGNQGEVFRVTLSSDGRTYDIESNFPLEADSSICWTSEGSEVVPKYELHCPATAISGFEISGGGGPDLIELGHVPVPATLSGGTDQDRLVGGSAADKILGGPGDDFIAGNGGADELLGDAGNDQIFGGPGDDRLEGRGGDDDLYGGIGADDLLGGVGSDKLCGGPGNDTLGGGPGVDVLIGGAGHNILRP